ncbi:MAG: FAD-dependent monooxygenase [Methyloceanibacter sp.]|uniref:FAD-dependent monooxygenase n=1 Tax=Methyloceanibacter sp. TaxID=1965321 RepID=UPI001DC65ECB|nr:FAD-dependent monooxygenase [Methyloceanibacter sp.]MCB1443080.1 FAD-dependent monooxygenase [Methyloceanibacter sp.]
MTDQRPVLIAGGGIGGLTTAIALGRKDIDSQVLERSAFDNEAGAGIQLGPNATRILGPLGVLDVLMPKTFRPEAVWLFDGLSGKKLATVPLGDTAERRYGAPYLTAHRADLHEALRAAAANARHVTLTPNFTVASIEDGGGITVASLDGPSVQGSALVGADGIWSTVRKWIAPEASLSFTGATAFRSLLPLGSLPSPFSEPIVGLWLGPRTHLVHYPVRSGEALNVVAVTETGRKEEGWNRSAETETVRANFTRWCETAQGLLEFAPSWRAWSLFSLSALPQWHRGPITLLGDAAHPVLPYLAQGAALAIEDAATLADHLDAARGSPGAAFQAYERVRGVRADRVRRTSQRLGRAYHMGDAGLGGMARIARNAILGLRGADATLRGFDWLYGYGR